MCTQLTRIHVRDGPYSGLYVEPHYLTTTEFCQITEIPDLENKT